jgi:hypothetical protein
MPAMIEVMIRSRWSLLMFLAAFGAARALAAGDQKDPDWPCVQRKVPSISAGMVWAGPEIGEDDDRQWQQHADVAELVGRISSRRTPLEQAYAEIDGFASTLGSDRNEKLTLLFTGLLRTINAERSQVISGIERYARRQKELADKIKAERADLDSLHAKHDRSEEEVARTKDLERAFQWDTRVFDDRRDALSYVCESPVLLEQRIFSLARHVMSLLE